MHRRKLAGEVKWLASERLSLISYHCPTPSFPAASDPPLPLVRLELEVLPHLFQASGDSKHPPLLQSDATVPATHRNLGSSRARMQ